MAHIGTALAGFSLLFVGIDMMQDGMGAFQGLVTPDRFPPDTLSGRLQLVLLGVLVTVVTQSSSAGVAAALAAIASGAITLPQAAAMVIGMDIGTTFTAALATVGGSTAARQTGFAHVIYNVLTGVMAFVLLGPFIALMEIVAGIRRTGRRTGRTGCFPYHLQPSRHTDRHPARPTLHPADRNRDPAEGSGTDPPAGHRGDHRRGRGRRPGNRHGPRHIRRSVRPIFAGCSAAAGDAIGTSQGDHRRSDRDNAAIH